MAKEFKIEMKDGSKYEEAKRVELTDEQLEAISGGTWDYASNYDKCDQWDDMFNSGAEVVWRENGCIDHWCQVLGYDYVGDRIVTFDLDCVSEGFYVYGVPAEEVLMDFDF